MLGWSVEVSPALAGAIGSLITAAAAALREWSKNSKARREERSRTSLLEKFRRVRLLQDHLREARESCGAVRVLLLYAHNGGGPIEPHRPAYSTIVGEVARSPELVRLDDWRSEPLDISYWGLLERLLRDGSVLNETASMEAGKLRDLYRRDGIRWSLVKLIHVDPSHAGIWYLSCVLDQEEPPGPQQRDELRSLATKMKDTLLRGLP